MYRHLTQLLTTAQLISRPQGATIKTIEECAKVSRRTVYRLLEALEDFGYPIYDVFDGRERTVKLNEERNRLRYWIPLPKIQFSFEDRVMLDYLFREAAETPAVAESVAKLRRKISSLIAEGGYSLADKEEGAGKALTQKPALLRSAPVNKSMTTDDSEHLSCIFQAIQEKTVCIVSYEAMSSDSVKTYRIHPLAVFEHNGGLYLFVLVPYYGSIRILSIERIKTIDLTEEDFTPPDDFDAEKRLSDPFGIIVQEQFTAKIRFSSEQAPYVYEREWPAGSVIEDEEEGSIVLTLETGGAYELKRWVMSYGSSVELLEPEYIRKEIAEELRAAVFLYGLVIPT